MLFLCFPLIRRRLGEFMQKLSDQAGLNEKGGQLYDRRDNLVAEYAPQHPPYEILKEMPSVATRKKMKAVRDAALAARRAKASK